MQTPSRQQTLSRQTLAARLEPRYGPGEARAVVRLLLEDAFGLSMADVLTGALERLSREEALRLQAMMARLEQGEPVQHVVGHALFCDRPFIVTPDVLIPRPETEELCRWIVSDHDGQPLRALDAGTGSGCIALTLALTLKDSRLTAADISAAALAVARSNARRLGATGVHFLQADVLSATPALWQPASDLDLVVSNPPYICECEKAHMDDIVAGHEPALALFVPDDDPLRFYRAIARLARRRLRPGGRLYFELNPLHADELATMLGEMGFAQTTLRHDQFGKLRFSRCVKKPHT